MKKVIKTLFAIAISHSIVNAQNTISRDIDEVVVSGTRAEKNINSANIQIISSEEIKNAPVQTIEDLLEFAINVDIRQRGGQGVQSDISMRGGTFEQVLIMLNGVKLNDPQTGHHTLNLPISMEQVDRIEIITGGSSRIFGNYAYTGAINIITKRGGESSITISSGENSYKSTEINYNKSIRNFTHNFSVNQKESDGYIEGMDYNIKNYYYQISKKINNIDAIFNTGIINKEFGAFSFYTPKYPDQFERTNTTFTSLILQKKGDISINNKIYWRKNNDEFVLFRENPDWYHNFHETNVFGMDFNAVQQTKNGSNVIGVEIRTDNIISNVLGEDLVNPIQIDSNNFYKKGASRTSTNLFVEKNIKLEKLSISAGIMAIIDSEFGDEYFPGIDFGYKVNKDINIFYSYNKSMRTPNYTELYYSSPTNQGNEHLKSEYSTNKELGLKWKAKSHYTSFTVYQRDGEDMIDWTLQNGDSIWRTTNLNQLSTTGYEFNTRLDINKILNTNLPISNVSVNYAKNESDQKSEGFQSAYVLDHLRTNLSISANQIINSKLRVDWRASKQDREGGYTNFETGEEIEYLPFWLVSTRATYKAFNKGTIFLEINNLLDTEYVDFGNVPQSGRWMRAGVKITL